MIAQSLQVTKPVEKPMIYRQIPCACMRNLFGILLHYYRPAFSSG